MKVALEPGIYKNFTGYICFGDTEGFVRRATFNLFESKSSFNASLVYRKVIFKKGTWIGGELHDCIWNGGTFLDGTVKNICWSGGEWMNGTWIRGSWLDGTWHNGTWIDGDWYKGTWMNGDWNNGAWHDGTWQCGNFRKGVIDHMTVCFSDALEMMVRCGNLIGEIVLL